MLRFPGPRSPMLGLAPWAFCLLVFLALVRRAGLSPLPAAGGMVLFGLAMLYGLEALVHQPDRGIPFPKSCNWTRWSPGQRRAFFRESLVLVALGFVLALAALCFDRV